MEQIGSEYNFNTGGSIKALNDLIAKVEQLDKQVNKVKTDTETAGNGIGNLPNKIKPAVKQFDALGNSINQVTREFPAFAFSAQTGFLAVSNNIPILIDSINQLKVANAQLAAEGKATIPIFKQIVSSLISWQTALSLLISFSVMYGKEIGNFIANLFNASNGIETLTIRLDALNEAYKSKELSSNIASLIELRRNIDLAQEGYVNKEDVLKTYNEQFGKVLGTTNDVNIAEQRLIDNTPMLIQAYINRAASAKLVAEASQTLIDIQKEEEKVKSQSIATTNLQLGQLNDQLNKRQITEEEYLKKVNETYSRNSIENSIKERINGAGKLADLKKQYDNEIKLALDFAKKSEDVLNGVGIVDDVSKERQDAKLKALKDAETKRNKIINDSLKKELDAAQEVYIKKIETKGITDKEIVSAELELLDKQVAIYEEYKNYGEQFNNSYLDARQKRADKIISIDRKEKEELYKQLAEEYKTDEAFMNKTISSDIDAVNYKYAKMRESKVLTNKEELELDRAKTIEIISILNGYAEADAKIREKISEHILKLSGINVDIAKKEFDEITKYCQDDNTKNEKLLDETLNLELIRNKDHFLDIKSERLHTSKELLQIEVDEAKANYEILLKFEGQGAASQRRLFEGKKAYKDAEIKLSEEQAKEELKIKQAVRDKLLELGQTGADELIKYRTSVNKYETEQEISNAQKLFDNKSITEDEYNRRKRQALNEQARTQRQIDLSQIQINTALAVAKTFALYGYPAGIPLAILALAEGTIQYAFASAQPLPQFAKGTDMVSGGVRGKDSVHALLMPQEAVIPTKENLARPGLAKAWIDGNLDRHLMMNYVKPAIDENNRRWEATLKISQNSTFIRNDNFSDKRIVNGLNKINRKLSNNEQRVIITKGKGRIWN